MRRQPSRTARLRARADIFGTWLLAPMPGRSTSGPQPMIEFLTAAGKAAVAKYNPFKDDPAFRCDPGRSPPRMGRAGHATVDHRARRIA